MRDPAIAVVVSIAYVRVAAVLVGAVRSLRRRHHARWAKVDLVAVLAIAETVVLAAVAYPAYRQALGTPSSTERTIAAMAGAALAAAYLMLLLWSVLSWRGVFSGHLVTEDQPLVTTGAYGFVRHPLYLGALLLWVGVAIADLSPLAAVATLVVVPTYVVHAAREERMMTAAFGDAYRSYCSEVPGFIPALHRIP